MNAIKKPLFSLLALFALFRVLRLQNTAGARGVVVICNEISAVGAANAAISTDGTFIGAAITSKCLVNVLQFNVRRTDQTQPEKIPHRRIMAPAASFFQYWIWNFDLGFWTWLCVELVSGSSWASPL